MYVSSMTRQETENAIKVINDLLERQYQLKISEMTANGLASDMRKLREHLRHLEDQAQEENPNGAA